MWNKVESAESRARQDHDDSLKTNQAIRNIVIEEIDFLRRHGIPEATRLKDLDLNELGERHPKPNADPSAPQP